MPPESRLTLSIRELNAHLAHRGEPSEPTVRRVIAAQQNAVESFLIARTFQIVGREDATPLLVHLLKGNVDPLEDASSAARNYQFELVLLALCDLAGLDGRVGEPDIVLKSPAGHLGIAAKRLASQRAIPERVREAVAQIRGSTRTGIIALNVELIVTSIEAERARSTVEGVSITAYELVDAIGALGEIEGIFVLGAVLHRSHDGTPRLSYDFSLRMISPSESSAETVRANWAALGGRVSKRVNGLFEEAMGRQSRAGA